MRAGVVAKTTPTDRGPGTQSTTKTRRRWLAISLLLVLFVTRFGIIWAIKGLAAAAPALVSSK